MRNDFYDEYVNLCLKLSLKEDYVDRKNVRKHNRAMDQLSVLENQTSVLESADAVKRLMTHQDDRVRLHVSSWCLREGQYTQDVIEILKKIMNKSNDPTLRFSA